MTSTDILLSPNFHLSELLVSETARRKNIDNTPSQSIINNLTESAIKLWQPTRNALGKPMSVNSGYRSDKLNKAIGGSTTSAHSYGFAIDFIAPSFGTPEQIVRFLVKYFHKNNIKFDQIIMEHTWVHLGYKNKAGLQRGQVLIADFTKKPTAYINANYPKV